jgi:hypothetical protein
MKLGYYFYKTVSGGISWPLVPTGKLLLAAGMKRFEPPYIK